MAILLLDIPGLHLGFLGCYGNDWVVTPNLDRLASEGIVFDRHYAGCPGDLNTGRMVFPPVGAPGENWFAEHAGPFEFCHVRPGNKLAPIDETLPGMLTEILSALKKCRKIGPFVVWAELPGLAPPWKLAPEVLEVYFEDAADVSEASDVNEPWSDPPATLPPGDHNLDRLQFTYAAVVTYVDTHIGWLIDKLAKIGLLDQMLVLITSQQGLPLGEHGWIGYQRAWQHEEFVHVPLIVRLPGGAQAGLRIGALTQPMDVVPTLLEHLGIGAADVDGLSLWPLLRQEATELRPHAISAGQLGDSVEWSLRTLAWAFLLPTSQPAGDPERTPRLYVKPDDRWEVNDVRQHFPELIEQMETILGHRK